MIRVPTGHKRKKAQEKLNLVPIMDSVFIFIFFLLMSTSFLKIYEIDSDIPITSQSEPPKDQKDPLALTLKVSTKNISLYKGVPSRRIKRIKRTPQDDSYLEELHSYLIDLKKQYLNEDQIIIEPSDDLTYEEVVKIMDAVRKLNRTDEAIFKTNKEGVDIKLDHLFKKIIFNNFMN